MPSAMDIKDDYDNLSVLVGGPAGSGKSIFASSVPTPAYVIDTGKEMLSYRGKNFDYDTFPTDFRSWTKLTACLNDLKKGIIPFTKDAKGVGTKKTYKSYILDNTSGLTEIAMKRAMQLDSSRDEVGGPLWNVHYKLVTNSTHDFIRLFLELPGIRIVLAHTDIDKDEVEKRYMAELRLQGRLSGVLPGWFDEVLYGVPRRGKGGQAEYLLQTVNKGMYKARSRISGKARLLPDFIPNEWDYLVGKKKYIPIPVVEKKEK